MKKIGIVTLYGNFNYGNRLQNYAMQEIIRELGFDACTVVCERSDARSRIKPLYNRLLSAFRPECKRYVSFARFNKRHISTDVIRSKDGLIPKEISARYDKFAVGSDQVWNPGLRKRERSNFFLMFTEPDKKACISPSIGVSEIDGEYAEEYRGYLSDFRYLSCRELDGAKALSALTGKECEHIVDPTLALTADRWSELASPVRLPGKYIFMLFLGEVKEELRRRIEAYASEQGAEIIEISKKSDRYYSVSPSEFVYLIKHAHLVFTDSFHASAFSVNLNVPFYVFERHQNDGVSNRMTSRIASLVSLFGLEDRYVVGELGEINPQCDFEKANRTLPGEREKFFSYAKKVLND